ncbi:UDP-N-acetylmuramate--L-alanine ligase [Synechocystis sp. CACIAM 05]|uniref:UDP-N-acetylmuramate--L-alanine ligase n=1 Tax=Synechocystis sp. CACIAM 05 TaxID=1933929 RepID=UPI00138E8998|nr:UDP-N-acetylmuramate--L-alanine ligase [Synechocystis sp. CACIAM 05]QHV01333.1 UDP-N-acetylmuramate--L-alanine ligase [Synechocystis sp. CACIAM 05]
MRSVAVGAVDFSGRPFHFLGIGGIGMSALAYVLAKRHLPVSGSDLRRTHITDRLESVGAKIFQDQVPENLDYFQSLQVNPAVALPTGSPGPGLTLEQIAESASNGVNGNGRYQTHCLPQVVCSTAINEGNLEYQGAIAKNCPIYHRSDILAALIAESRGIGVAGTHGKTTTSSLIGYVLKEAGLDPTIVVGGEVDAWQGNAYLGSGEYLVAEVDESDGSLTKHHPEIGIVTNIELDHPDHYSTLAEVVEIFRTFESHCQTLIGCLDCGVVRQHLSPTITYSLENHPEADYQARQIKRQAHGNEVEVWERGVCLGTMTVTLPGDHNISNALAAVAVGRLLGLDFPVIAQAIASFNGAKRRFECKGYCNGITFIDDYAHHPSELLATLAAAKQKVTHGKYERVVAIFQPHRYSRTHTFMAEFATAFKDADLVVLTDIYSAGEQNPYNIRGEDLAKAVGQHHGHVVYQPRLTELREFLPKVLQSGDLALFLGAGNLNQQIAPVLAACA